jgi:hypothetical protein
MHGYSIVRYYRVIVYRVVIEYCIRGRHPGTDQNGKSTGTRSTVITRMMAWSATPTLKKSPKGRGRSALMNGTPEAQRQEPASRAPPGSPGPLASPHLPQLAPPEPALYLAFPPTQAVWNPYTFPERGRLVFASAGKSWIYP